ncbi:MAG: NUDIX domain-containing protein, partial [Candidatus Uhrbacteria bacterium]|nr:NUDIX domain-containing protein [Candidatus Uhrbacteria bacterium]
NDGMDAEQGNERQAKLGMLAARLQAHGVPLGRWGVGEARRLEDLLKELESGEATLEEGPEGRLLRTSHGARVTVYYTSDSGRWKLVEDRQEYVGGGVRKRTADLPMSVGEKLKPGESADVAARRALSEELGIEGEIPLQNIGEDKRHSPSKAFPGIDTCYVSSDYAVELPVEHYKPEGYIERQPDKTTFFVWEKVAE